MFTALDSLSEMLLNEAASEDFVRVLAETLPTSIPEDYFDFLMCNNGGEGFVGDEYLIMFNAEEIVRFNQGYEVEKYAPGLLLFGSNGGGEGYAFDTTSEECPVVKVPFIGMDHRYAKVVGQNLSDFILQLSDA